MWSLFPPTSSGNLNNSLYLPPAAPRIWLHELRDRSKAFPWGSRESRGSPAAPSPARCSPAPTAPRGPEKSSGRGKQALGRGMGPGRRPRARALAPAPPPVPCAARPCPRPPDPAPSQQRALAEASGAPRYLGSDPAGRSPRRCHSALREIDTQTQLGFEGRPAAADLAPARAPLAPSAQGQGEASARGGGRQAVGMRAAASLPRIRRFFSERPRPIAAILTGFSHNTGNLAQSRENPFPSPRASPAPSSISPALPQRRAAGGGDSAPGAQRAPCRLGLGGACGCASSGSGTRGRAAARLTLWEHVCWEGTCPTRGIPLIRVYRWRMLPLQPPREP